MTALTIALTLAAFGFGAWLGVLSGRKQGYETGYNASTETRVRIETARVEEEERLAARRRSDGARQAAITRKRNREQQA